MPPPLFLYNSLGRRKEEFVPLDPGHIRVYACGPTVYSYAHIGNARMAVAFDLLVRLLRNRYPRVTYVSNITDVDDKIMAAAQETGTPIGVLTRKFEAIYNQDIQALGCALPDIQPRATEHLPEMIALIGRLIERGYAYVAGEGNNRHVLFHVPSFAAYGVLSGRNRDDQIAGARVEVAPYKKDPADFVLWKPSSPDQPGWESPWGFGRPGWHIECSAMSEKHLGLPFDIHGGGVDLTFPHHENEIAQSCCAHAAPGIGTSDGRDFARYWVHNGFVMVEGRKMSKSLGNVLLAHDLLERTPGEALRWTLLSAQYRQPLDWTQDAVRRSRAILDHLYQSLYELGYTPENGHPLAPVPDDILGPLSDDLNTPLALAALQAMVRRAAEQPQGAQRDSLLESIGAAGRLLGLLRQSPARWVGYRQDGDESAESEKIEALLQERAQARQLKNFKRSDEIRDQLLAQGIVIEDTPQGPRWKRVTGEPT